MPQAIPATLIPGDGIGPEIVDSTLAALDALDAPFQWERKIAGLEAAKAVGDPLPADTIASIRRTRLALKGPLETPSGGGYRSSNVRLREEFKLYANLRPVRLPQALSHACPLTPERQANGIDILVVRELTGGIYFGQPKKTEDLGGGSFRATDTLVYTTKEIERIAHVSFKAARLRRKKLTSIDKANVLENGVLWREVVTRIGKEYPDVALEHMFVDNGAMQLMLRPTQFDVLLCENMFGDILSDEAAALAGSLGMLPSASLGATSQGTTFGFYEPAGGSAPDIAGKNLANPIAQILSVALMLRYSFGLNEAADGIETAVTKAIAAGNRTGDIFSPKETGARKIGTREMGEAIAAAL